MKTNKIHCIDALEGIRQIEDESVDLIITSPPYNLGNDHHIHGRRFECYDDEKEESSYQTWQKEVLDECYRVLKKNGSLFYNHKNRIKDGLQISPYLWINRTEFLIKQEIVWVNRGQNFDKRRFFPWTERIYWLCKNPKIRLNNTVNRPDVVTSKDWSPVGIRKDHPRQFPLKMIREIISMFKDAKIILDPFMGSGTTAVACKQLGRQFIGFEIEQKYIDLANERLQQSTIKQWEH